MRTYELHYKHSSGQERVVYATFSSEGVELIEAMQSFLENSVHQYFFNEETQEFGTYTFQYAEVNRVPDDFIERQFLYLTNKKATINESLKRLAQLKKIEFKYL